MIALEKIVNLIIIVGVLIMTVTGCWFYSQHSFVANSVRFNDYGSFIGGIVGSLFSLVSVLLLVKTLKEQQKQQIEGRFFELLRSHREHVSHLKVGDVSGPACFKELVGASTYCYDHLKEEFKNDDIDDASMLDLSYLAFFFGTFGDESERSLRPMLSKILKKEKLIEKVFRFVNQGFWEEWNNPGENEDVINILSPGYRHILGHYWRHLFHTVQFVNNQSILNYSEKYHLIRTLRVQMSDEEKLLLFFNSLSTLGKNWEKGVDKKKVNEHLITKYDLIRNIPEGLWKNSDLRRYYPNVHYELDEFPEYEKQVLIKRYK